MMSGALPSDFFEAINGILTVMCAWVVFWFAFDIASVYRDLHRNMWMVYRETAASIACMIAFTGDGIIRAAVWNFRNQYGAGPAPKEAEQLTVLVVAIGVMVAIVGCSCIIVHLAPRRLGAWPWIIAMLTALAFAVAT